jgi:AraC family transcriptional regulator of adaptative response/methylated-DNA-[protein]-cysteine methyltransferase
MSAIIRYAQGDSTLGRFVAAMSDRGLAMMEFEPMESGPLGGAPLDELRARFPDAVLVEDGAVLQGTLALLAGLIEHPETTLDLPLDMRGSKFELRVWHALQEIPAGRSLRPPGPPPYALALCVRARSAPACARSPSGSHRCRRPS